MNLKIKNIGLILTFLLIEITIWSETDIFIPSMPDMVVFFKTTESKIQLLLTLNFIGLFISAILAGPFADAYGRKIILMVGMIIFILATIGCILSKNFTIILIFRFIQGLGAGIPMALAWVLILDEYEEKFVEISGIVYSIITAALAGAPIVGSYLNVKFFWQANFIAIFILSIITIICILLFVNDKFKPERNSKLSLSIITQDYLLLLRSRKYIGNVILVALSYSCIMIYISNLSLIFINHLNISEVNFGYYQASTMIIYMLGSAISSKLISKWGSDVTNSIGCYMILTGSVTLLFTGLFFYNNPILICLFMNILTAGVAISINIISFRAVKEFPDKKGIASSLFTIARLIILSILVELSSMFFTGNIRPIAIMIFVVTLLATYIYVDLNKKHYDEKI